MLKIFIFCKKLFKSLLIFSIDSALISKKYTKRNDTFTVVKLDAIGDFIIYISSEDLIPSEYKSMKKVLICNFLVYELAKSLKTFDHVIPINLKKFKENIFYRVKTISYIISIKSKIVIQPTYSRYFDIGDTVVRVSGAEQKIGFDGDNNNQKKFLKLISNKWYTKIIKGDNYIKMEKERNHEFLEKFSNQKLPYKQYFLPKLKKIDITKFPLKKYILICPGASLKAKCWPSSSFQELIKKILRNHKFKIILCGTKGEKELLKEIANNINSNLLEEISGINLIEYIEIIRNALCVIGNDSSAVHIASLVKTKSICIYGGRLYGRFLPYPKNAKYAPIPVFNNNCRDNNWSCKKNHNCLAQIKADDVIKNLDFIKK